MASSKRSSSSKSNEHTHETRESIAAQTEKFLESGGKIQEIPSGVSGQTTTSGPRHITLGKRKTHQQ